MNDILFSGLAGSEDRLEQARLPSVPSWGLDDTTDESSSEVESDMPASLAKQDAPNWESNLIEMTEDGGTHYTAWRLFCLAACGDIPNQGGPSSPLADCVVDADDTSNVVRDTGSHDGAQHNVKPASALTVEAAARRREKRTRINNDNEDSSPSKDDQYSPKRPKTDERRRFACPYHQRNFLLYCGIRPPNRDFGYCSGPGFLTAQHVKEHLLRFHERPPQCHRCAQVVETEDEAIYCCCTNEAKRSWLEFPYTDGLSAKDCKTLRDIKVRKGSGEELWHRLDEFCHPDRKERIFPYYINHLENLRNSDAGQNLQASLVQ